MNAKKSITKCLLILSICGIAGSFGNVSAQAQTSDSLRYCYTQAENALIGNIILENEAYAENEKEYQNIIKAYQAKEESWERSELIHKEREANLLEGQRLLTQEIDRLLKIPRIIEKTKWFVWVAAILGSAAVGFTAGVIWIKTR